MFKQRIKLKVKAALGILLRKMLGPYVRAIVAETSQGLFAVDPEDLSVGRDLLTKGVYGREEIERLGQFLTTESAVLVVGAHVGSLVIPLSGLCKKVVAIEANPTTFGLLEINLRINDVRNCRALNVAASDRKETLQFIINRTNSGGSKRMPVIRDYRYFYDNPETIQVPAVPLDDLFRDEAIDLIVMDIEGSEYFALKGMQTILSRANVLQLEFLPHHIKNVGGVSIEEFAGLLVRHFETMMVPSRKLVCHGADIFQTLVEMYQCNLEDDGLIFTKAGSSVVLP